MRGGGHVDGHYRSGGLIVIGLHLLAVVILYVYRRGLAMKHVARIMAVVVFFTSTTAWAQDAAQQDCINYQCKYIVTFDDGNTFKLDEEDIDIRSNTVGIRYKGENEFKYYSRDQITSVTSKTKSNWKIGMGIGAGVGAVVVGGALGGWGASINCDRQDTDFGGLCGTKTGLLFGLGGAAAGALIGLGVGAGIGSAIPKKKKVSMQPTVYVNPQSGSSGLGLRGQF